jgi:hypothetical protein
MKRGSAVLARHERTWYARVRHQVSATGDGLDDLDDVAVTQHGRRVFAADQRFAVVLDGDGTLRPAELRQQVADCGRVCNADRFAVGGDGDQDFLAAACLAAAFFSAL